MKLFNEFVFRFAIFILPKAKRVLYEEAWKADLESAKVGKFCRLLDSADLIRASFGIRFVEIGAIKFLATFGVIAAALALYGAFYFSRSWLIALVLWIIFKNFDFRRAATRKAILASAIFFAASGMQISFLAIAPQAHSGAFPLSRYIEWVMPTALISSAVATNIAGLIALILWLIDFIKTENVVTSGKIFMMLVVIGAALSALQQTADTMVVLGSPIIAENEYVKVSKLLQAAINLELPAMIAAFAVPLIIKFSVQLFRRVRQIGQA